MTTSLAKAFCLVTDRRNFQINVRASADDRRAYFGNRRMNHQLIRDIRRQYQMGMPPKKFVYGLYGVGKTHTLFNVVYNLEENPDSNFPDNIRCRYIEGEFGKKTTFTYLYGRIMNAIGLREVTRLIQHYLQTNAGPDLRDRLERHFGDVDVAKAVHTLGVGAHDVTLWKWLSGGRLSASELTGLGLTKNLSSAGELTSTLVALGKLFQEEDIYYIFLLDELEGIRNVKDNDAQRSFHDAFRRLADDANDTIGFIVSTYATNDEAIPDFIFELDIRTRIGGNNIHELQYLQDPGDVRTFLKGLMDLVVDEAAVREAMQRGEIANGMELYPFTDDALDQFVTIATESTTASLPRNIIKAVNECAVAAVNRGSRVIEVEDLAPCDSIFVEVEY